MNKLFVQTAWQIMESLRDANVLENALSSTLEILQKSIGCEDGAIWMMDDQSESIIAVSCCGPNNYVGMGAKPETGILAKVMSTGNSETDGPLPDGIPLFSDDDTTHFPLENILCVPLKTPQNTLGCIHLGNKTDGDFTEDEIQTVENCAAIIALDIEDKGFQFRPNEDRTAILSLRGIVKEFMSGDEIRRILNGIDQGRYDPERDSELYKNYSEKDLSGKLENKKSLLEELGLSEDGSPVISMVTRLADHKGVE